MGIKADSSHSSATRANSTVTAADLITATAAATAAGTRTKAASPPERRTARNEAHRHETSSLLLLYRLLGCFVPNYLAPTSSRLSKLCALGCNSGYK